SANNSGNRRSAISDNPVMRPPLKGISGYHCSASHSSSDCLSVPKSLQTAIASARRSTGLRAAPGRVHSRHAPLVIVNVIAKQRPAIALPTLRHIIADVAPAAGDH
ncbi:hypothetical protein OY671_012156, partial [Metschnikowia pulcherrima]